MVFGIPLKKLRGLTGEETKAQISVLALNEKSFVAYPWRPWPDVPEICMEPIWSLCPKIYAKIILSVHRYRLT